MRRLTRNLLIGSMAGLMLGTTLYLSSRGRARRGITREPEDVRALGRKIADMVLAMADTVASRLEEGKGALMRRTGLWGLRFGMQRD